MKKIGNDWDEILEDEFNSDYYKQIREFLKKEYQTQTIYPSMYDIFNAFKYTSYKNVKAVLLGQDPYHGPNQAHGLCFSVKKEITPPPSLVNIFKELKSDTAIDPPRHGCLIDWANSGVMLLNTVLTVRAGSANSHKNCGWTTFTDNVIKKLNAREQPLVFLLWGNNAKQKNGFLTNPNHLVLSCAHPSPLSASNGFFGCRHFSKTNDFLKKNNIAPIDWHLTDLD